MPDLEGLPGAELIRDGVRDLAEGLHTPAALAMAVAASRLRALGITVDDAHLDGEREIALYRALGAEGVDDPYHRYNAILRELTSFLEACEARRGGGLDSPPAPV